MIRQTMMNRTDFDQQLVALEVQCQYLHVAEPEDFWGSNPHMHDRNEICYVVHGRGVYDIDGVEYSMEAGDVFFLPKGWRHGEKCDLDNPYELRFVMVENVGATAQEIDEIFFSKPMRVRSDSSKQIKRIWDQIMEEVIEHNDGYLAMVAANLKMLYTLMYRQLCADGVRQSEKHFAKPHIRRRDFLVDHIREYVEMNVGGSISVEKLAQAVHYHPKYLTQMIKRETGKTLTEFILSVRLNHACELLAKTQHSVADILNMCGFVNASHFFRVFKQEIGITPTQYRKKFLNVPRDTFSEHPHARVEKDLK